MVISDRAATVSVWSAAEAEATMAAKDLVNRCDKITVLSDFRPDPTPTQGGVKLKLADCGVGSEGSLLVVGGGLYSGMDKKYLISKLNEVSKRYGRGDVEIEINNLATKVHSLLEGRCGKLTEDQGKGLMKIGESVLVVAGPEPLRMARLRKRYGANQEKCMDTGRKGI